MIEAILSDWPDDGGEMSVAQIAENFGMSRGAAREAVRFGMSIGLFVRRDGNASFFRGHLYRVGDRSLAKAVATQRFSKFGEVRAFVLGYSIRGVKFGG